MNNHIITKFSSVVPYAYEYESENDHICRSYTAICGIFIQHKNIMLRNRPTCKIIGQQHAMLNKIVNINHTVTKFATIVPYTCMIMCTNFGKKRTFAKITLKNRMDPSSRSQACGRIQGGGGQWTIVSLPNLVPLFHMLICVCAQILGRKRPQLHICRSCTAIRGTFIQEHMPRNTCKITGQQRAMFNKIININHTITKFATVVPHTCMIMCTNFGKKRTTFAEVTLRNRLDPSSQTHASVPHNILSSVVCVFIFVLLGKNIGRQTATRIHEQKA